MDPIAHTLVGAGLAATGLRRRAPYAAAALIIGANLPDIDGVATFLGSDGSLAWRRGWTHGVLAMAVLPSLLALGLWWLARRRVPDRATFLPLLGLSYLAVATHPALDWLNTYGVRLLMPFDGTWFYGDTLFIVDPWLWLLAGLATFAGARDRRALGRAIGVAMALSAIVMFVPGVPRMVRVFWLVGLVLAALASTSAHTPARARTTARISLALLAAYIAAMFAGNVAARTLARRSPLAHGAVTIIAAPLAANPFARDVIFVFADRYRFALVNLLHASVTPSQPEVMIAGDGPIVAAALAAPTIQGFRNWLRLPSFVVEPRADGYIVTIRDQRYARMNARGFGAVTVELDGGLRPIAGRDRPHPAPRVR